jgi:hypothetical protein
MRGSCNRSSSGWRENCLSTAAGFANMVPLLHVCSELLGLLQLARTMAEWFKYVDRRRSSVPCSVYHSLYGPQEVESRS